MSHGNIVLTASAGTGKTHQLSTRYLQLLLQEEDAPRVERILATTFTRKAAGEIFDRIVGRLVNSLTEPRGPQKLAESLGHADLDGPRCMKCLQALTRQLHRTRVLTLDAFFAELALNFSMELSLPAHWRIADDALARRVRDRAIGRMLIELGGAAATKLVHQLAKGELKRDVDSLLDTAIKDLFDIFRAASDFGDDAWNWLDSGARDSPAAQVAFLAGLEELLRGGEEPGKRLGGAIDKALEFVKNQQWLKVSETTLIHTARSSGTFGRTKLPPHIRQALDLIAARAADGLRSTLMWQNQAMLKLLTAYARHYREVCHEQHIAFFSDITHALRDFRHRHDALGYRLDGQIDHLLLDEFQDTSPDQWRIIQPIADRILNHATGSFFCVGDVKQAIYAWRHGSSEILQDLAKRLPAQTMHETRRSYPAVVDLINQVFLNLQRHDVCNEIDSESEIVDRARAEAIASWVKEFPPHVSHQQGWEVQADGQVIMGYACLRSAPQPVDTEKPLAATQKYVAQLVAQMLAASPRHSIGILVRTNDSVTQIIHHLRQLGINASEIGGNPLTNSAPARLILSLLRFADHPGHSAARYHVSSSPLAAELGLACSASGKTPDMLNFARRLRHDLLRKGYGTTIAELTNQLAVHCTPLQRRRLRQLVDLAYIFQPSATPRPSDFIEFVEATRVADPTTANVHVLTIHQAKGLEYDRVVVTELDKLFRAPSYCYQRDPTTYAPRRIAAYVNRCAQRLMGTELVELYREDQRRNFREELCNLYVALTRARFELQLVVQPTNADADKFPPTLAGLVRAALCDSVRLDPETIPVRRGDEDWHRSLTVPPGPMCRSVRVSQSKMDTIRFRASASSPLSASPTSPSELEGAARMSAATLFSESRQASMRQGTLIHGWFESIEWLGETPPSVQQLQSVAKQLGITASEELLSEFLRTLSRPQLQQVLCYDGYQAEAGAWLESVTAGSQLRFEVRNEQPIVFGDSRRVLSGVVDRLVLVWSGEQIIAADIIDYKTDEVDSASELRARCEFYAPQLTAYREAVAGMLRLEPNHVRARLVFTESGAIVRV